ncbi:MAG: hypothetical protein JZU63_05370, partial [Rhodoferax sp.]|nr:hypothetical protein [Rhodoferax sp.]
LRALQHEVDRCAGNLANFDNAAYLNSVLMEAFARAYGCNFVVIKVRQDVSEGDESLQGEAECVECIFSPQPTYVCHQIQNARPDV